MLGYTAFSGWVNWCATAVTVWQKRSGATTNQFYLNRSAASCTMTKDWAIGKGIWLDNQKKINTPKAGMVVQYKWSSGWKNWDNPDSDHTGIVLWVDLVNRTMKVVEGNKNPDYVTSRTLSFDAYEIRGYIDVKYDEEVDDMTNEEVVKIIKDQTPEIVRRVIAENESDTAMKAGSGWSKEARDWAIENGFIKGAKMADGTVEYKWRSKSSREEMIEVLYRMTLAPKG